MYVCTPEFKSAEKAKRNSLITLGINIQSRAKVISISYFSQPMKRVTGIIHVCCTWTLIFTMVTEYRRHSTLQTES